MLLRERFSALRECVERFCPYGFRATWHHLVVSAGIPQRLEDDPASLDRAIAELAEAREPFMAHRAAYAEYRRAEKAAGRRCPKELTAGRPNLLAYCPEPEVHPRERLVVVVTRVLDAPPDEDRCRACGTTRAPVDVCPECGVAPHNFPSGPQTAYRWRQIWQRTAHLARRP